MSTIQTPVYQFGLYPVNPYIGQSIFDSTTGKVLYYYGPTIGWQQQWGTPWGAIVDVQTSSTDAVPTAEGDLTGLIVTWTTLQNRKYLVQMNARYSSSPESIGTYLFLTDGGNVHKMEAVVSVAGTSQNKGKEITLTERYLAYSAGSVTRKGRTRKTSPSDTKNIGPDCSLRVYDIGAFAGPVYVPYPVGIWNTTNWNQAGWG